MFTYNEEMGYSKPPWKLIYDGIMDESEDDSFKKIIEEFRRKGREAARKS